MWAKRGAKASGKLLLLYSACEGQEPLLYMSKMVWSRTEADLDTALVLIYRNFGCVLERNFYR